MNTNTSSLLEEFSCLGFWWFPGIAQPASGILTFKPGASLSLEVFRLDIKNYNPQTFENIDLIFGVTKKNRFFYLLNSAIQDNTASFVGVSTRHQLLLPQYVVETDSRLDWKTSKSVLFTEMGAGFDNLSSWMNLHPIQSEFNDPNRPVQVLEVPERTRYKTQAGSTITFSAVSNVGVEGSDPSVTTGNISFRSHIALQPKEKKDIDWYVDQFTRLKHWLIVLMGAPTNINHLQGKVQPVNSDRPVNALVYWDQTINVKREKHIPTRKMLVPFDELVDGESKLNKWLEDYDSLNEQISLFSETILSPGMHTPFRWLALTQAIESFHRKVFGGYYLDRDTYIANVAPVIKNAIPPALPSDHRDALKSRVDFGFQYSLEKRLRDFLSRLPSDLVTVFLKRLNIDKTRDFTVRVKDTRNYYTHLDAGIRKLNEDEQDEYAIVLKQLMFAHFMAHMGFTEQQLKEVFLKNPRQTVKKKMAKKKHSKKSSKKKAVKKKKQATKKKSKKVKKKNG